MKIITQNISTLLSPRYISKQKKDIAQYGEKFIPRYKTVTPEILEEITPFRRLSEKGSNLSDNKWFIDKFKKNTEEEFLPDKWEKMSEQEKANYIVRERYSSLVANKIMNKIKDETTEHSYSLYRGDIINYSHGNKTSVTTEKYFADADVHNHPVGVILKNSTPAELQTYQILSPNIFSCKVPHSGKDILGATIQNRKAYVIDSNGHKFVYMPKNRNRTDAKEHFLKAIRIQKKMEEKDKEVQKKFLSMWGHLFIDSAKNTTEFSNEQIIDDAIQLYHNKVYALTLPIIGLYRSILLKSDVIKNIGKFTDLGK